MTKDKNILDKFDFKESYLVKCKYSKKREKDDDVFSCQFNRIVDVPYDCRHITCYSPNLVTWTFYLINKKHLIEVTE